MWLVTIWAEDMPIAQKQFLFKQESAAKSLAERLQDNGVDASYKHLPVEDDEEYIKSYNARYGVLL